jgi:hypothetical protein
VTCGSTTHPAPRGCGNVDTWLMLYCIRAKKIRYYFSSPASLPLPSFLLSLSFLSLLRPLPPNTRQGRAQAPSSSQTELSSIYTVATTSQKVSSFYSFLVKRLFYYFLLEPRNDMWQYNVQTSIWNLVGGAPVPLETDTPYAPPALFNASYFTYGTSLWLFGGYNANSNLYCIYISPPLLSLSLDLLIINYGYLQIIPFGSSTAQRSRGPSSP